MENIAPEMTHASTTDALKDDHGGLYRADRFDPNEAVSHLIRLALSSLHAQIDKDLEPHGLTAMQWQPLSIIAMGRAGTAADLSRQMHIDTGATTRMLDRLAAKGLLTRERSNTDRRLVRLKLTEAGHAAARAVPSVVCGAMNAHLAGFTPEDLDQMKRLLTQMIRNGRTHYDEVQHA